MRVEKVAIKWAASAAGCASSQIYRCLEPPGRGRGSHEASLLATKLTNRGPHTRCHTPPQTSSSVSGPHWLWQIQSKRSLETRVLVSFRKALEKTRLQIELSGHLGDRFHRSAGLERSALALLGGRGGRRPGRTVGSCAGRRNVTFKTFWRLRVGKSSTRMANRCPRIFDAGG